VDGKKKVAANADLHAMLPAEQLNFDTGARKFCLSRYSPSEWVAANRALCQKAQDAQLAALV